MRPVTEPPVAASPATRYHATWVLPVTAAPIRQGWVEVRGGVVGAFGGHTDHPENRAARVVDLPGHVVLPALVNAHTHLELSGLRGRIPPARTMPAWARQAMKGMADRPPDESAIRQALDDARSSGTGVFGDVSNTDAALGPLTGAGFDSVVFRELIGFDVRDGTDLVARQLASLCAQTAERPNASRVRPGLAAHAPYSVSPPLFRAIRGVVGDDPTMPLSVHLAESREELQFLATGQGPWRSVLEERGRWDPAWTPHPGGCVTYLDGLGWLTSRTLVVHGVYLTDPELDHLARVGVTLVACPRSNTWTGAGQPPVERFYASGVPVAIGTDSLASVPDLNMFSEMAEMHRLAPDVAPSALLSSATRVGAVALGFTDRGAIQVGMRPGLIAVRCAESLSDVEEYLVSGIEPDQVIVLDTPC